MPAPMPLEPPVTRATLPLNDFVCIWPQKPQGHPLCHIMDCSVQNEHSAGAAHIRANGRNDKIICMGGTCAPLRGRLWRQGHGLSGFPSGISPAKSASRQRLSVTAGAFLGTATDDPITSGLPVTWQQFCVGTSSPPPRGPWRFSTLVPSPTAAQPFLISDSPRGLVPVDYLAAICPSQCL